MRQILNVVAMNFGDLLQLKQAVKKALDGLLHLPSEDREISITFRWASDEWSMRIESQCSDQRYASHAPQGASSADWVHLVSEDLENHLLCGSQFTLKEVTGDVEQNFYTLYLERA